MMRIGKQAGIDLESSMIRLLRADENLSRVELARRMELAPSTVGQYIDRLIGDGFVKEGRKAIQPAGRPPIVLELNSGAGQFVGVDFEARQVLAVAVDFAQQPLRQHRIPLRSTDNVQQVIECIEEAINHVRVPDQPLLGIGLGVPGTVDSQSGVCLHYEHIPDWHEVRLGEILGELFDVPVSLENNIRAIALAEQLFGQGRTVSNFISLGIRSGIGAGVVINGELYRGPENLAGEIAKWPCDHGESLESLASLRALCRQVQERVRSGRTKGSRWQKKTVYAEDLIMAAESGDELVLEILKEAASVVGKVVAQLNLALNPQKVLIAGPLGELEDAFVSQVRKVVHQLPHPSHSNVPEVSGSLLGEFSGALGGASLAVNRWSPIRN